jgi:hypothetical protein
LSEIIRLIESERDSEGRAKYFEKLAEHLPSAFGWIEVPRIDPKMTPEEWVEHVGKFHTISVTLPNEQELRFSVNQTLPLHFVMMECQSFVMDSNEFFSNLPDGVGKMVSTYDPDLQCQVRLMACFWNADRSTTTTFEFYPGETVSLCDSIFAILCNLQTSNLDLRIVRSEKDCGISSPGPGKMFLDQTLLNLLKKVSDRTGKQMLNDTFVQKIFSHLIHPFETLNINSSVLSCIIRYPFLFPQETRLLAAKPNGLDVVLHPSSIHQ